MINKPKYRHKKSAYETYICMADETYKIAGSYEGYLKLKDVIVVLEKIANTSPDSVEFYYNKQMRKKKVTQSEALTILDNIYKGKWSATTAKCILVANQMGVNLK